MVDGKRLMNLLAHEFRETPLRGQKEFIRGTSITLGNLTQDIILSQIPRDLLPLLVQLEKQVLADVVAVGTFGEAFQIADISSCFPDDRFLDVQVLLSSLPRYLVLSWYERSSLRGMDVSIPAQSAQGTTPA